MNLIECLQLKRFRKILLLFGFLLVWSAQSFAQLTVSTDIAANTTWTTADSPVTVQNTISVAEGATLTIDPGVTVQFDSGASLLVDGALVADGMEGNIILFTSSSLTPAPGDWGSIEFRNTNPVGSVMDYVTVEYGAGSSRTGMIFYTTGAFSVNISNAIIRNSAVHGINLRASNPIISGSDISNNAEFGVFTDLSLGYSVQNSNITNNGVGGIRVPLNSNATINENNIEANPVGILIDNGGSPEITSNQIINNDVGIQVIEVGATAPVITDNTISGNTTFGAENLGSNTLDARLNFWGSSLGPTVDSNPSGTGDAITDNILYAPWRYGATDLPVTEVSADITANTTWSAGNVYHVLNNITVSATLTIEAGTIVKFASGVTMTVSGNLLSNGTASNLVIFTSERDDAAGGDSNGDGDATLPAPDDWVIIDIESTSGSSLSYTNIRYGGSASNNGVLFLNAATVLSNIVVSQNAGNGIYATVDQTLSWTQIGSVDNTGNGVYLLDVAADFKGGNLSLNDGNGLYSRSATVEKIISLDFVTIDGNNSNGLWIDGTTSRFGTRISIVQNSTITNNGQNGLLIENAVSKETIAAQNYFNNTIEGNGGHGINLSHSQPVEQIVFEDNTILNNGQSGILSSRATFINNTFEGNRFGIGAWKNLGHVYTDGSGVDSNTFTNNTYPNAVALYGTELDGLLSDVVPQSFPNPTYILAGISSPAVGSSGVLNISAGVTVKALNSLSNRSFLVQGEMNAEGSPVSPIVFTSLRDNTYGGEVNNANDTADPARGNWGGIEFNGGSTLNSVLTEVYIRYAGTGIRFGSFGGSPPAYEYVNTFQNIWVDNSSRDGIQARESALIFDGLRATNNGNSGVEISDGNGNNGFVARVTIRNSEITGNGGTNTFFAGLLAQSSGDGAAFPEISNSTISGNSIGVRMNNPSIPVSLIGNVIETSTSHGVLIESANVAEDVLFAGNQFLNNAESGVVSSRARFIDNTFDGNRFGVGAWKRLGHIYTDGVGVDGNVFTNNTYNNAVAIYANDLDGLLSTVVPQAFTNPTYILASISSPAVGSGGVLNISGGVTIKALNSLSNRSFLVQGELNAEGSPISPIVFTSLRDNAYGGAVNQASDTADPAPGNWGGISFNGGNTVNSVLTEVYVRYASTGIQFGSFGGSPPAYDYVNTFQNVRVENAQRDGIQARESALIFDGLRATNNGNSGVEISDGNSNNGFVARVTIRNSEITGNGGTNTFYAGLLAQSSGDGASFPEISNSTISGNSIGVNIERSSIPVTIQFNTIENNVSHGILARLSGIATEETLTISGNSFNGHSNGTGAIVSRAIITDNVFENNEFPIGLLGELSVESGPNIDGTTYSGNTIGTHTYQDAIALYTQSNLSLNGKLGFNWPESYTNPVYIPINRTTYINSGNRVEVAPGTVFKLGHTSTNDYMYIQGELNAAGLEENKIVFTSVRDDTFGGDTNKDSNTTLPGRNNWDHLWFRDDGSSASLLQNVIVRYGDRNLYFDNSDAIFESGFSSNSVYGVFTNDTAIPTIRNSDIHSNRYGIYVSGNSGDPVLQLNNIYDNDDAGLYVFRDVTATDNYWGDATGPFVDQGPDLNLDGLGNRILISGSNEVTYRPFLTDRTGVLLGDVSENGDISAFDASLILQYLVDLITLESTQLAAADVSGNGTITSQDASFILQFVVDIITGFPGAGKLPAFEPEEVYEVSTEITDAYYDIVISSKGKLNLLGGLLKLNYPADEIASVEMISSPELADWTDLRNEGEGKLAWALAGVSPIENRVDAYHIRFHLKDGVTPDASQFEITSLVMNEMDLTSHAEEGFSEEIEAAQIPEIFSLDQNFPNPFNPVTSIRYKLPVSGEVSVRVFNSIGQQVAVLVNNQVQNAGSYQLEWNALDVASGVYFYRIDVSGANGKAFSDVKRMTLIK
ncbi:right-handed parallel beta-helix repeat-containing protein [Rhodohalobacter mucosus]|uniref:right-handed parallel beta-helix repeat-containing protein n=1 Tax=Rhodohalobacter mucosus TaxID=2079485 RepID=UPI001304BBB7|nr:right-handed parallel beta-helix repeat-containing protein [Rhodohalobacter mucosus]